MKKNNQEFRRIKESLMENNQLIHVNLLLQRASSLWPNKTALICGDESITYQQLEKKAAAITQLIRSHNLAESARIILIYENSINFYAAYYAILQAGAIVVPLNVYLHAKELDYIIGDCKPSMIIVSEKQKEKLKDIAYPGSILSEEIFKTHELSHSVESITPPQLPITDCSIILYTSGTTGFPKGVMLSSQAVINNAIQGIANFEITDHERVYAALPLFHSYMQNAAVWCPFIVGATVIIIPSINRTNLLKGLKQNPTVILGIPQLYGLFALMKTAPLEGVKLFISGGDALHNKIRMFFELIYNRIIANGYGLTEAGPFVAVNLEERRMPLGCIGKPLEGIQVEIRNEEGVALQKGEIGSLWIKGKNLMLGYYNASQATANIVQNNWLNTGDLAYLNNAHEIIICGREKDLIINKGVKIYPPEVENILMLHPDVLFAAVVGKKQHDTEIPVAFVAIKNPPQNIEQILKDLCIRHLAQYKVPIEIYIRSELPLNATGKIDKKQLKKELE